VNRRFDSPYYPPSKPREAVGGIRAKSARGKIASTWWSSRFIEVLEGMGMGSRLTRGRNYARRGQVLSLELAAGVVTAAVQGSRARPYRVRIGVNAFGKSEWAQIEERLSRDAWFVAQLLAGQMPPDIEALFDEVGSALFPDRGQLVLDCSCPDWEVPCKHLAAVFYLLAERFDEDPFQILAWRGRSREELLERLDTAPSPTEDAAPLTELLDVFWSSPGTAGSDSGHAPTSPLLPQLPPLAMTARGRPLAELLGPAYDALVETRAESGADSDYAWESAPESGA